MCLFMLLEVQRRELVFYRMGISKFIKELENDYYIYGQLNDEFVEFELGIDYEGFLAQRKF